MARIIEAFSQFFDDNGDPLVNGWLKFNESGTNNTDKTTYADINESIPNTNPLQLDGAGRCPNVFGPGAYNVISFADDVVNPGQPGQQIQQFDPVGGTNGEGEFSDWAATEIYSVGDIVTASNGRYYRSLTNDNENNEPSSSPAQWEEVTLNQIWNENVTYGITDTVYASDGLIYISRINGNIGNNPITDFTNWRLLNDDPELLNNSTFAATVNAKSLTCKLLTNVLLDPTAGDKVIAAFRNAVLAEASYEIGTATTSTSIIVPSGATLGFANDQDSFIYLYAINNAGTIELAVSKTILSESILHTTVAIDATSDSGAVLYSNTARIDIAIRLIGRIKIQTGAVAGEWDNAPTILYTGTGSPVITEEFISSEQTITNGGSLTLAHSLSKAPSLVQCRLICKIAEHGYSIGDELIAPMIKQSTATTDNNGIAVFPDFINVGIRFAQSTPFLILNKTTGVSVVLTNANWRLIVRAWA